MGEDAARTFRLLIADLPRLVVLGVDERHRLTVDRKLDALRGTKLTYVDASSLVWLASKRIATVWGRITISPSRGRRWSPALRTADPSKPGD